MKRAIIDTGIEDVHVDIAPNGDVEIVGDLRVSRILKWLEREGKKIWFDKSQKKHVQLFAQQGCVHAQMVRDELRRVVNMRKSEQLGGSPKFIYGLLLDVAYSAFIAGYNYHRLNIVNAEEDAMAGSKSRQARRRGNRKRKKGSAEEAILEIPNFWKMPAAKIVDKLKKRNPDSVQRQFRRLKAERKNNGQ